MGTKSFRDWLAEGESLYTQALGEYQSLEAQLDQIEKSLAAKKAEVNQIGHVIGKPPIEPTRRLSAQLVEAQSVPQGSGNVARALTGRGLIRA